jgi:hypothetical protein
MIKETKVKKSRTDLTRQLFNMKMDTKIGFREVTRGGGAETDVNTVLKVGLK